MGTDARLTFYPVPCEKDSKIPTSRPDFRRHGRNFGRDRLARDSDLRIDVPMSLPSYNFKLTQISQIIYFRKTSITVTSF